MKVDPRGSIASRRVEVSTSFGRSKLDEEEDQYLELARKQRSRGSQPNKKR